MKLKPLNYRSLARYVPVLSAVAAVLLLGLSAWGVFSTTRKLHAEAEAKRKEITALEDEENKITARLGTLKDELKEKDAQLIEKDARLIEKDARLEAEDTQLQKLIGELEAARKAFPKLPNARPEDFERSIERVIRLLDSAEAAKEIASGQKHAESARFLLDKMEPYTSSDDVKETERKGYLAEVFLVMSELERKFGAQPKATELLANARVMFREAVEGTETIRRSYWHSRLMNTYSGPHAPITREQAENGCSNDAFAHKNGAKTRSVCALHLAEASEIYKNEKPRNWKLAAWSYVLALPRVDGRSGARHRSRREYA